MTTTVLVGEHSLGIQKIIELSLQSPKIQLILTTSYQAFIAKLEKLELDLFILDTGLPGLAQGEGLGGFLATASKLPGLFLQGHYDTEEHQLAISPGFREVLPKPFEVSQLLSTIHRLCPQLQDTNIGVPAKAPQPSPPPLATQDIRQIVESYCQDNFKAIAQQVIKEELHRLLEQKAQLLVDNS